MEYTYDYPEKYNNIIVDKIISEIIKISTEKDHLILKHIDFDNAEHLLFLNVFNNFNGILIKKITLYLECTPFFWFKNRKNMRKYNIKMWKENFTNPDDFVFLTGFFNILFYTICVEEKNTELSNFIRERAGKSAYSLFADTYHRFYEEVNNESNSN